MKRGEYTLVYGEDGDLLITTARGDCIIGHEDVKDLLISGKTVSVIREHTGTGAVTIEGYALLNHTKDTVIICLSAEFMQTAQPFSTLFIPVAGMKMVAQGRAISAPLLAFQNPCIYNPRPSESS